MLFEVNALRGNWYTLGPEVLFLIGKSSTTKDARFFFVGRREQGVLEVSPAFLRMATGLSSLDGGEEPTSAILQLFQALAAARQRTGLPLAGTLVAQFEFLHVLLLPGGASLFAPELLHEVLGVWHHDAERGEFVQVPIEPPQEPSPELLAGGRGEPEGTNRPEA